MKYLKNFESIDIHPLSSKLRKGYYVICHSFVNSNGINKEILNNFLDNNIGQYVKFNNEFDYQYGIKYENVPKHLKNAFKLDGLYWAMRKEIFDWSKNKNELELKLNIKKYNI